MIEKQTLNVVFIGNVDSGKSTLIGTLLHYLDAIPDEILKRIGKQACHTGPGSYHYINAFQCRMEQERGITINITHRRVEIKHYFLNLIDIPGKSKVRLRCKYSQFN